MKSEKIIKSKESSWKFTKIVWLNQIKFDFFFCFGYGSNWLLILMIVCQQQTWAKELFKIRKFHYCDQKDNFKQEKLKFLPHLNESN